MSYRDDLGQAHRRIEQLEGELREAKAPAEGDSKAPRAAWRRAFVAIAVVALVVVAAVVVANTRKAALVIVTSADQVVRHPDAYAGKQLRVQGELVAGTIVKLGADDKCELRFTMERDHLRLPVHLDNCIAPLAFRDVAGVTLVVVGELQRDGTFAATELIARQDLPNMRE